MLLFRLNFRKPSFVLGLFVFFRQKFLDQLNHFLVGNACCAVFDIVLVGHPSHNFHELCFFQPVFTAQAQEIIYPQRNTVRAGLVGYFYRGRTLEQFARVEDIVNLLFAKQAVSVNTGFGFGEVIADKRCADWEYASRSSGKISRCR